MKDTLTSEEPSLIEWVLQFPGFPAWIRNRGSILKRMGKALERDSKAGTRNKKV